MQLKKFYFSKGGYGAYTHKLEYLDGKFHYSTFPEMEDGGIYIDMGQPARITPGGKIVLV